MEIDSQPVFGFVDNNYVLRKLLETQHAAILLPIDLEGTVGKVLEKLGQPGIVAELLHVIETQPADDLSDLVYSSLVTQYFYDIWLSPFPDSDRFF